MERVDNNLKLVVADDGIGMPEEFEWKKSNSLGLQLVRDLVEKQLNGSIELDNTNGTKFTITLNFEPYYK